MKSSHKYLYTLAAVVMLSCLQSCQQHEETIISKNTVLQDKNHENVSDTSSVHVASQPFQDFANVRQPDKRVRARKGHALLIETEGLSLAATDTAVIRSDTYSVTSLFPEELPPLPQGMTNMTACAAGYRLLPGGEHFYPYAKLSVKYDPSRLPFGYTAEDIYTSYYDTVSAMWVRLERVAIDTVEHEIVSLTTHFTDFINELLKSPEMPETQAFVPTALTDLEAVSPMDALPLITAPEANNNGTANMSYPLVIPAGRGGMQPNLALNYSSGGGSGWLGVGWDIPVPSITLDTRWGVPRYDATYETEIYMLNGEQLVAKDSDGEILEMPHRTNQQTPRSELGDTVQFFARTGDAHDSIIRYGDSPKNYRWKVIDRYGTTHYYGLYHDTSRCMPQPISLLPDTNTIVYGNTPRPYVINTQAGTNIPVWRPYPGALYDDNHNIVRWMLTESRDLYGNTVRYYYDKATVRNRGAVGRQIYLDSISYTGYKEDDGYYTVVFCRTGNTTTDIPVSCNNGFKEITDQLLNNVYLKCGDSIRTIWHFELENGDSTNYKNRLVSVTKIDTVGEMGMRGLLNSFCHCIQQDEDEYATASDNGAYIFMPDSTSFILNTIYVPKPQVITIKPDLGPEELHSNVNHPLYQYVQNNLCPPNCSDSLLYAILDSIYYNATYFNSEGLRCYRYISGYEYEARVDTVWVTFFDTLSIPHHINPLSSFSTLNYAGATTTFEYYNAPDSYSLFGDEKTIYLNDNNLHGFYLSDPLNSNPATWLRTRATGLGLTTSSSWNVGGAATVGLGPVVCLSNASLGGNYTRSGSSSETQMTLVDLDGDGMNDKVYVRGNNVYFCRQQWNESDSLFYFDSSVIVKGIHHIMRSSSTSNTFGVQAALYASAGANWTKTTSTTSTYFADVNGDGLIDLVDNGQVYFNHCTADGVPEFTRYSDVPTTTQDGEEVTTSAVVESTNNVCGDIIFDGAADSNINCRRVWVLIDSFTTTLRERETYTWLNKHLEDTIYKMTEKKEGLHVNVYHREWDCSYHDESLATDAVRVWIAPRKGQINITSRIKLLEDTSLSRSVARHADGVALSIQKTANINSGHSSFDTGSVNISLKDILINSDDYTMHVDPDLRDSVSPGDMIFFRLRSKSDYHFDDVYARFTIDYTDSNDFTERYHWHFDSQEDFVLSSDGYFQAPVDGHCKVQFTWDSDPGNVTAEVFWKNDNDITPYNIFEENISQGDEIYVVLSSDDSNIQWGDVVCKPYITFTPDPDAELYDTIDTVNMVIDTSRFTADVEGWLAPHVNYDNYYTIYETPLYRRLFGPLYKGWGQFAYRSEGADADLIQIEKLVPPDMMVSGNTNTDDRDQMDTMTSHGPDTTSFGQSESLEEFHSNNQNFYSPYSSSSSWVEMTPDVEHWAWVGYGHQNTVGRDTISNSVRTDWYSSTPDENLVNPDNLEEPEVNVTAQTVVHDDPIPAASHGTPAKAVNKVNRSKSHSWSVGFLGAGYSNSESDNTIEIDYMDLNGDRYPDIIGTDMVQYSQQWGGVGPARTLNSALSHGSASHTWSGGLSFSASQVTQERTICGIQQNALFTMHSEGSGSVSAGGNVGHDKAGGSWVDMNGDGLPDFVYPDGHVRLNIGYDFVDDQKWGFSDVRNGISGAISVGAGLQGTESETVTDLLSGVTNISQSSIEAGVGVDGSYNQTTHMLMDINGDGLPDMLWRELNRIDSIVNGGDFVKTMVKYNLGAGRFSNTETLNIGRFHSSATFSESLNLGFTYGFTVWGFKITVGANGSPYSAGVTQDYVQLADVNADGLPDWVYSIKEDEMTVRYNMGGKANLLKKVTNFTGSSIALDYTLSEASYRQPSRGWMMTNVTTDDPLNTNGARTSITEYSYGNPYYDRYERMSYGFDSVVTKQLDPVTHNPLRFVERGYNNRSLMQRGKLTRERIYDGSHKLYVEKLMSSTMVDYLSGELVGDQNCPVMAYPLREGIYTHYYEGSNTRKLTTREVMVYDRYHNLIRDSIFGDFNDPNDDLLVELTYYSNQPNNLIGLRENYKIISLGPDPALREAHFEYDGNGKLASQTIGGVMTYDFKYDNYGNLAWAALPENDNHQRVEYNYTYDTVVHTYPEIIDNISYGEKMKMTDYDYLIGKPQKVTDPSDNTMTYTYDFAGRLTSVRSPKNQSHVPSLINRYYIKGYYHHTFRPLGNMSNGIKPRPYSVTDHYDDNGDLITRTVVITDGFGRVLQTKKGLTESGADMMQVSGHTHVDALGHIDKQYDPFTVPHSTLTLGNLDSSSTAALMSTTTYDVLDRVTEVRQPLGIITQYYYNVANDATNHRRFYTRVTDPNGNVTQQYADYEGRQVQVTDANGGITTMHYDNIGQLLWSRDPEGFTTYYGYDNLGRLIRRVHPDAGTTKYDYDPAGNLKEETNPLGTIFYNYTYYRPKFKRYSYMTGNDVTYEYGTSGNDKGRLVFVTDGSGSYECHYDALGNVIDEIRTISLPQNNTEVYRFKMSYQYDSWGRMHTMTYPDGETITYTYQWGGDLYAMLGDKNGNARTYIKGIYYNSYGQKEHIDYGNTTGAKYTYDSLHRLVNLRSYDYSGTLMQDIDYTFDNSSNVMEIVNNAGVVNTLGGAYENTYKYDALHRLAGSYGGGAIGSYNTNLAYSPSGRLIWKFRESSSVASVDMAYGYCDKYQPHAVKRMFDYKNGMLYDMRWDEAGNLGQVSMGRPGEMFETGRFLFWTEDSRMHAAVDDKHYSYYAYDHSGQRRLKLVGDNCSMDVNAEYMNASSALNEPTLYPSAYMVLTNKGYTKHYYAGTERVAARLGGGGLNAQYHVIDNDDGLQTKADMLFGQSLEQVNSRVLHENDLDCIMGSEFAKKEFGHWIDGIPHQMKAEVKCDHGMFKEMVHSMLDDNYHGQEKDVYFYHSDHLGSASWITDFEGMAVQHLQYLPYGEPFVDQRISGYSERFRFTGKERDEETGYGYFGARYMDHELMTMWLSVDPMADKYPSISPYAYCAWNPIKLVDPNGMEIDVSHLSEAIRTRLVNCLSEITGLSLYVDNGKLNYRKDENGSALISSSGSRTAGADLIEAIDKKNEDGSNYVIGVIRSTNKCEGGQNENKNGGIVRMYCSKMLEAEDAQTNGLGMVFLHELRHAVTGEHDPGKSACDYNALGDPHSLKTGPVVDRVNEYRRELGMPIRIQYVSRHDGVVPFLDVKYDITRENIRKHVIWKNLKSKRDE